MEWKDLNIKDYQNLCKEIDEDYPDDLERSIGLLSCLTGKPIHFYTDEMPMNKLNSELKRLKFIKEACPKIKIHSTIRVGKKRFRFNLNMRTISAGQYMDFTELVKDKEKINDNLHTILANLCVEINWFGFKKKSTISERAEYLLHNLRMPYAISLSGFFLSNYQRLIKGTNDFLESETEKMRKKSKEAVDLALSSIGDGIIL